MPVERRRTHRVTARGNAVVHAACGPTRCDIVNLSMGGVLLRAVDAHRPELHVSDAVEVDVHLDGESTAWIGAGGLVRRLEGNGAFCVTFGAISAALEDVVEDEVLAGVESERRPRAIVVDAEPERATRLAEGLDAAGCKAEIATSPLEAIWRIEQSRAHIVIALVSEPTSAATLMDFLREVHPAVLRAAIGERPQGGLDDLEWIFTNQPDVGSQLRRLVGRVQTPLWAIARRRRAR